MAGGWCRSQGRPRTGLQECVEVQTVADRGQSPRVQMCKTSYEELWQGPRCGQRTGATHSMQDRLKNLERCHSVAFKSQAVASGRGLQQHSTGRRTRREIEHERTIEVDGEASLVATPLPTHTPWHLWEAKQAISHKHVNIRSCKL